MTIPNDAHIWKIGSHGAGARHWFVWRNLGDGRGNQTLETKAGNTRWFKSPDAAQRAADIANGPD